MKRYILLFTLVLCSCIEDIHHDAIDTSILNPNIEDATILTYSELFNLHNNPIGKDTMVVGYVVSTDINGNFYKEVYIQNTAEVNDLGEDNPRMGLRIRLGLKSVSAKYAIGRKVAINLEGLKRITTDNLITIGVSDGNFIRDISEFDIDHHILKYDEIVEVTPKTATIEELKENDLNTLIKLENLHFKESEIGIPLAGLPTDNFDGKRILEYCSTFKRDTIILETSNFSDFSENTIPNTQVNVTAVYTINFEDEPVLNLNEIEDLEPLETYESCNVNIPNILITEIADPENSSFSRYVELYNAESEDINLRGWHLNRYINGSSESNISLDDLTIKANGFVLIAKKEDSTENNLNFKNSFGFDADLYHTNLDGNGDDAYSLTNETGAVIDIYGVETEDGTNADWDYENGRAYRVIGVNKPNEVFTFSEWQIVKGGKNAPEDFTPGERSEEEVKIIAETAPILITEVADPDKATGARFVEIYNPTKAEVNLVGWSLIRYNYTTTNNTKLLAAKTMDLDGLTIEANGFVIITKNLTDFNTYFDKDADLSFSNLDGNGDDAYELIDPFGNVIDVFGEVTLDGTGSNWEYTDGVAKRKINTNTPKTTFDINDWDIQKEQETIDVYSPGIR